MNNKALNQAATDLVITLRLVRGGRPVRSGAIQAVHGHRTDPMATLLDEFEIAARPSLDKPLVLELLQGEDLDRRENNLLVGPYGTGATGHCAGNIRLQPVSGLLGLRCR